MALFSEKMKIAFLKFRADASWLPTHAATAQSHALKPSRLKEWQHQSQRRVCAPDCLPSVYANRADIEATSRIGSHVSRILPDGKPVAHGLFAELRRVSRTFGDVGSDWFHQSILYHSVSTLSRKDQISTVVIICIAQSYRRYCRRGVTNTLAVWSPNSCCRNYLN